MTFKDSMTNALYMVVSCLKAVDQWEQTAKPKVTSARRMFHTISGPTSGPLSFNKNKPTDCYMLRPHQDHY